VVKVYPVAVGAQRSPSPTGAFEIVTRVPKPTFYHPGIVIPPGPRNPLGTRWIGLNRKGYGIHGTNDPRSIGRRVSHGCIRMRNRDVEELFELVTVGDRVELYGERTAELEQIFGRMEE
jgi:lipoprotein-anchoring transpeptidase ErfK/SrfK